MTYSQDGHPIGIDTPLGRDRLLLTAISGEEAVSRNFSFQLEMLSTDPAIRAEEIVGQAVSVRMRQANGQDRRIHGYIASFHAGWTTPQGPRVYGATLVPWLWFLTQTTDCRVFQDKSATDIAGDLFEEYGFDHVDMTGVIEPHPAWTCSIQYQESHYAYLSRLMEREGIFHFFRHEKDRHTLVLGDSNLAFKDQPEGEVVVNEDGGVGGQVDAWRHDYRFHAGRWATSDYNYKKPSTSLLSTENMLMPVAGMEKYEVFEWPGGYYHRDDGDALVRHRLEEKESGYHLVEGGGTCASFAAGTRFKLANHPDPKERRTPYVLLRVRHQARDDSYLSGNLEDYAYHNDFTAFPLISHVTDSEIQYRPPRLTPKPLIHGTQTAVVVGPPDEEIHCDEYARVKIQFHWDRHGQKDNTSSPWVRVSQAWAGKGYGTLHLPHVGQEVIISFSEGDPDRPLIIGRVYNATEKNPLVADALDNKTQTMTKDQGGNVISTEGKAGGQQIMLSSPTSSSSIQIGAVDGLTASAGAAGLLGSGLSLSTVGDMVKAANNNSDDFTGVSTITIGGNEYSVTAGDSYKIAAGGTYKISLGNSETMTVGNDKKYTHGDSEGYTIGKTQKYAISADMSFNIATSLSMFLGAKQELKISESLSISIGAEQKIGLSTSFSFDLVKYEISLQKDTAAISKNEFILTKSNVIMTKSDFAAAQAEIVASANETNAMLLAIRAIESESANVASNAAVVRSDNVSVASVVTVIHCTN